MQQQNEMINEIRSFIDGLRNGNDKLNLVCLNDIDFQNKMQELDEKFIKEAKEHGFENLKGHRTVGGMRASIYNAMPIEGVKALVEFMKKFEEEN